MHWAPKRITAQTFTILGSDGQEIVKIFALDGVAVAQLRKLGVVLHTRQPIFELVTAEMEERPTTKPPNVPRSSANTRSKRR